MFRGFSEMHVRTDFKYIFDADKTHHSSMLSTLSILFIETLKSFISHFEQVTETSVFETLKEVNVTEASVSTHFNKLSKAPNLSKFLLMIYCTLYVCNM